MPNKKTREADDMPTTLRSRLMHLEVDFIVLNKMNRDNQMDGQKRFYRILHACSYMYVCFSLSRDQGVTLYNNGGLYKSHQGGTKYYIRFKLCSNFYFEHC